MSSSSSLHAAKAALRKEMKASLKAISEASRSQQSAEVTRKLLALAEYQRAKGVAVYLSMKDEIDTLEILKDVLR